METVEIKNGTTQLHYVEQGKGEITLLFVHGWCINSDYWNSQFEFFSNQYKLIAVDLPGFGKSESNRKEWTIEQYGEDIIGLIDALGLKNVILIGHSMGGEIILEAALTNHESIIGFIGIDNFKMIDVQFSPEQYEEMNNMFSLMKKDFKNVAPSYAENMLFHPSTDSLDKARVMNNIRNTDPEIGFLSLENLIKYSMNEPAKLKELNYKLYLISSDAVPTNTAGLDKYCKSSYEIALIHATGHYPMIEKPEEFNKLLEQTLEKIKSDRKN